MQVKSLGWSWRLTESNSLAYYSHSRPFTAKNRRWKGCTFLRIFLCATVVKKIINQRNDVEGIYTHA